MFSQIIKFIRVLGSEASPMQISFGFALGMIVGLTPVASLHNLAVLFILLVFRINLASFLLAWPFFAFIGFFLDPYFHDLGLHLLKHPELQTVWTQMYNENIWRIARFNNTIVMGSLTASLIAFIPVIIIANIFIRQYRSRILIWIQNSRIYRFMQNSKMFSRAVGMAE